MTNPIESRWFIRVFAGAVYLMAFAAPVSIVAAQALAAIILVWGHMLLWSGARRNQLHFGQAILILAFMTILLVSSILSPDFSAAIPQLKKSWVLFCFFPLTVLGWAYTPRHVIQALIAGTAVASAIGIVRFLAGGIERAAPFSGGYTTMALCEAAALPFAIVLIAEKGRSRILYFAALVLIVAGLFLTQTRAGWLAAIVAALLVGFYLNRKATLGALAIALVAGVILPQFRGIVQNRMASDRQGGFTSGRTHLWSEALKPLAKLPLFGHGPGSFRRLAPDSLYVKVGDPGIRSWHSTPLDVLIESGPLALAAIAGGLIIPLAFAWRAFKGRRCLVEGLGLFAALVALYLAGLTTNVFRDFMLLCLVVIFWSLALRAEERTAEMLIGGYGPVS